MKYQNGERQEKKKEEIHWNQSNAVTAKRQNGQQKKDYSWTLDTPINSLQMDLEKIVFVIFSNLSLNIDMGKKKLKNK